MSGPVSPPPPGPGPGMPRLPDRTANFAREFLSALFMSLRTAQIHDPTNRAYQSALTRLQQSAEALFAATGGFEVRIVEDAYFINGARLRFDQGSAAAMRTLRSLLEAQSLGGFTIESAPTAQGLLELVSLIADKSGRPSDGYEDDLRKLNINMLAPQRVVDGPTKAEVDRGTLAVRTYAKLILAVGERIRGLTPGGTGDPSGGFGGEIRAVRVVQDLVELVSDRIDLLLRLATNTHGASPEELHGANTCVLATAIGYSLGFHRRDLGDLGTVALFHHLGPRVLPPDARHHDLLIAAAMGRSLSDSGVGRSLFTRAMILAEQQTSSGTGPRRAHPFSRVLRVAIAYSRLVLGFGVADGAPRSPVDALATLRRDATGWFDPQCVDLLINLLRAYPPGAEVVLESGHYAVVSTPLNWRWDRPIVRVASKPPMSVDLMGQAEGKFSNAVVGTQKFLGAQPAQGQATAAPVPVAPDRPAAKPALPPVPSNVGRRAPSSVVARSTLTALPTSAAPAPPPRGEAPTPSVDDLMLPVNPPPLRTNAGLPGPPALPPTALGPAAHGTRRRAPSQDRPPAALGPAAHGPSRRAPGRDGPPAAPRPPLPREPAAALNEPAPIRPTGDDASAPVRFGRPRPDRLIGSFLAGKYRILEKVGEGGMGTVFLASQEPIDRQVAVKVLHSNLATDEIAVRRFQREARVISRMRHPNTVTIYDFGQTQAGELYLVMEYLEGQTVAQLLRSEGPLTGLRAARIIRQVCGSLSEAHEHNIIHRDLKPDNIFLTRYGNNQDFVKVLDFGLVKLADNETVHALTQQGKVYGTPRYMAPEQAEGKPIDHRSDIYTLGVVLYELLMGRPLFTAETMVALLVKHIQNQPPPMAAVRPDLDVDPRLESIVMWSLAKKAADRPQTVKELARELERWEHEMQASFSGITPTPPPPGHPGWTTSAAGDDIRSLDSLLDDFLEELSPLGDDGNDDD